MTQTTEEETTAVATIDRDALKAEILAEADAEVSSKVRVLTALVGGDQARAERYIRMAALAVKKTPGLTTVPKEKLFLAVQEVARLNLEIGPMGAFLVPRKGDISVEVAPQGYIELAMRSGLVKDVEARVVYKADTFAVEYGSTKSLKHVPNPFSAPDETKNPLLGAYCVITLTTGGQIIEAMGMEEIEQARAASTSNTNRPDSPWVKWYTEMCRKTVLKRAMKYCPKSTEMRDAMELDDRQYEIARAEREAEVPKGAGALGTMERLKLTSGQAPMKPIEVKAAQAELVPITADVKDEVVANLAAHPPAPAGKGLMKEVREAVKELRAVNAPEAERIAAQLTEWKSAPGGVSEEQAEETLAAIDALMPVEEAVAA